MIKALRYLTYATTVAILALIAVRVYVIISSLDYSWSYVGINLMKLYDVILLVAAAFWFTSVMYLVRELLKNSSKTYFLEALIKDILKCTKKSILILSIGVIILMTASIALTGSLIYAQRLVLDIIAFSLLYIAVSKTIKVVERHA